jgi:hypothetical protein
VRLLERLNSPIAVAVVLVIVLVVDGILLYRYQRAFPPTGDQATYNTAAEETSPPLGREPTATEETPSSPKDEEGSGVRVLVSVVNEPVGVTVLEDGQVVHDQVTNPGFSEEFEAEEAVSVVAANGGAVLVGVDGENPEPLGPAGEPADRIFAAESES